MRRLRTSALPVFSVVFCAALNLALLSGCAVRRADEAPGPPAAGARAPASGLPASGILAGYERRIDPFEVMDEDGEPFAFPFLGGFNVPRPQLVDIDGDGDLDLFVQEASGSIMFFENVGPPGERRFVWRTDRFQDLDVGEWFRFADIDGDGDPDLLGEAPYSLIRIWENVGGRAAPRFELLVDTLRSAAGEPIFADRQSIPNVIDLDCNGRLDLLLGRLDGTVTRYEATEADFDGAPVFEHVTDRFEGIEIIGQITPSARHGSNTLVLFDIDEDGDPDLFWGDFFEPGLLLIENRGTCEAPSFRGEPTPFPAGDPLRTSGYNAATFGDLDGNGRLDLVVGVLGGAFNPARTAADNLYRLEREEGGWRLLTRRLIDQIDIGSESVPALGDLDGDGDLDLLVGNKIDPDNPRTGRIYHFENVGTVERPALRARGVLPIEGEFHYAPALADLDGDGDLDLIVGTWNEGIWLYENVGTAAEPRFERGETPLVELTRGSHATPALADVDGDGDLDLVAGESSGEINVWRNDGTPEEPRFVLVSDNFGGIDVGRRSRPALADLDGDGAPDLIVGSESGEVVVYRNVGAPGEIAFETEPWSRRTIDGLAAPVFGDLDGDGHLELLVGVIGGGLRFYESNR
ncbi:MAG TPA: VCBS repeat-containing protein [Gemmatimonadota bacterium]|nr:VCBS repeat-containing protein [Gemmatimonadota bacterium]